MSHLKKRLKRPWLWIGFAFSLFWALYLWILGPRPAPPRLGDSGTSEPASYSWHLLDLEDHPTSLARFRGKTIFLNIWATSCGPCVEELPSIARLADEPRLAGKDVAFVCVSVDDTTEAVRQFLSGKSWKMHVFRAEKIPAVFLPEGIPATFIIAPDGRIAAKEVGATRWDSPETIALLEKLAAEPSQAP